MLPFDRKPWAKPVAATVVVVTVLAALAAPFYLDHIRHLDPPMVVLIVLLVLAIVPPNLAIMRRCPEVHDKDRKPAAGHAPAYASRPSGR